jgi:PhzF family phenazine biosynthesis protein
MIQAPLYQVDAFTDRIFGGNPAAVVPLRQWPEDELLQLIARENNLSETAFFIVKGNAFEIRWFTPTMEVDLCGHATLATAHVLFHHLRYKKDTIGFITREHGMVTVFRKHELLYLDFPATPPRKITRDLSVSEGLGIEPADILESRDLLVLFDSEEEVLALKPDFELLKTWPHLGVIATARGTREDFVSRFFAPRAGIQEDPVTGSAHTTLIPFWSERLGKTEMVATQRSDRTGVLHCSLADDRVYIGGKAVTYLKGEICC